MEPIIERGVVLAPRTTLELGGPAEFFVDVEDDIALARACEWARRRGMPLTILGGGSNVLVADEGVPGLVVAMRSRGIAWHDDDGDRVRVRAAAGERWDDLVAFATARGLFGIECLSGIPGSVGATPIQNVGAYGQEVADVITGVRVLEAGTSASRWLTPAECGFAYRSSAFKTTRRGDVVLEVEMSLARDAVAPPRHREIVEAIDDPAPTAAAIRDAVIAVRRRKSMVIDPHDDNRRSVGSFFTNPIVPATVAADVRARSHAGDAMPAWPQPDGRVKLAAAWLIEHSGTLRGERYGAVGVSSKHTLALVHHGGGTMAELLALADMIADRVAQHFGIALALEPVRLGPA
jgi:UDP-N-acetylmuramate dehydrogenase